MTNYEKIKNMSVKEMATFLHNIDVYYEDDLPMKIFNFTCDMPDAKADIKQWLESEVEE